MCFYYVFYVSMCLIIKYSMCFFYVPYVPMCLFVLRLFKNSLSHPSNACKVFPLATR